MAKIKVHPIQLQYSVTDDEQVCDLCGAKEQWTASVAPPVEGAALSRSLHLVHLVRAHHEEVMNTFKSSERAKRVSIDVD